MVMVIESSPTNLDLRQGTDAQSERVGGLIFDALVKKDAHFELQPWLATSWEQPDNVTWVCFICGMGYVFRMAGRWRRWMWRGRFAA